MKCAKSAREIIGTKETDLISVPSRRDPVGGSRTIVRSKPLRDMTFSFARDRRAADAAVDRLMVGHHDVEGDVTLKLPRCQRHVPLRKLMRIAEGRARQQVQPRHLRPDQAFDVASETRLAWWSPFDRDVSVLASSLEGSAAEVRTIIDL